MKKVFLVALVFFGLQTQAQVGTDLQFSQIISLSGEFSTNVFIGPYGSTTYHMIGQVPAGKIWKFNSGNTKQGTWDPNDCLMPPSLGEISSGIFVKKNFPTTGDLYVPISSNAPVYFTENEQLYTQLRCTMDYNLNPPAGYGGCVKYVFQAIEYTVIP